MRLSREYVFKSQNPTSRNINALKLGSLRPLIVRRYQMGTNKSLYPKAGVGTEGNGNTHE